MHRTFIVRLRQWSTMRRFRSRMDRSGRPPRTSDSAPSPAGMDGHRLELAEACRAVVEALDRRGDAADAT